MPGMQISKQGGAAWLMAVVMALAGGRVTSAATVADALEAGPAIAAAGDPAALAPAPVLNTATATATFSATTGAAPAGPAYEAGPAPAGGPAALFGAPAIGSERLDGLRGGSEAVSNNIQLNGVVGANSAVNVTTGANTIADGAFANAAGLPMVIQNSGANVLIQNATVINLQLK